MILVPANKVEKIKYFSTLLGLIFIEITRGPFSKHRSEYFLSIEDSKTNFIKTTVYAIYWWQQKQFLNKPTVYVYWWTDDT